MYVLVVISERYWVLRCLSQAGSCEPPVPAGNQVCTLLSSEWTHWIAAVQPGWGCGGGNRTNRESKDYYTLRVNVSLIFSGIDYSKLIQAKTCFLAHQIDSMSIWYLSHTTALYTVLVKCRLLLLYNMCHLSLLLYLCRDLLGMSHNAGW